MTRTPASRRLSYPERDTESRKELQSRAVANDAVAKTGIPPPKELAAGLGANVMRAEYVRLISRRRSSPASSI
jgi:hypothetical protein